MTAKARRSKPTKKYLDRRRAIVDVASAILNQKGLKGMTLGDVGEHFGMVATGIAYYFSSKEELSAACFYRAIETFDALFAQAVQGATVEERIGVLMREYFALRSRIAAGELPCYAQFDDVRALGDKGVIAAYVQMFRNARRLLEPLLRPGMQRSALNARAHLLLWQFLWFEAWLPQYDPDDYPRVADRVTDILLRGLGSDAAAWRPEQLAIPRAAKSAGDEAELTFLRAAIDLINESGYLGASVEKIAAKVDVTKGAFYHHIDAKDDLVAICFAHTIDVVRSAQKAGVALRADGYNRLASTLLWLVRHQLTGDMPLLRAATVSLPGEIRRKVLDAYAHNTVRFGAMLSDGMLDGSVRMLDTQIAAHMATGVANAIGELTFWLPQPASGDAAEEFIRPFFEGLTTPLDRAAGQD